MHSIGATRSNLIVHDRANSRKVCVGRREIERLERVVLDGDLLDEVVADEGNLLHNILANLGNVGEEEEGKDAGDGAVSSSSGSAMNVLVCARGRCMSEEGLIEAGACSRKVHVGRWIHGCRRRK